MKVTVDLEPMDRFTLANSVRIFGLPLPPLVVGVGMHFHTTIEGLALKALQSYLDNNDWSVKLHAFRLLSEDNFQHIHALQLEGIVTDYPKTVDMVLPFLREELGDEPEMQTTFEILDIIGDDLQPSLEQVQFLRNPEKMTKILGIIVRENQDKLCERFNDLLVQKAIPVQIRAIHIME